MKLIDILEDVVDFAAKKKEREFMDKVSAMAEPDYDDPALMDLAPKENKILIQLQKNYGEELRGMTKFLKRPVMSGGFKSAYDLDEALKSWRHRLTKAPEQLRRAIQKAAADDELYRNVQKHNALWHAITNKYPMEVVWVIPNIDDFEVLEDLDANLTAARKYFLGK
jgi:hypothetical protein